ncbi:radical SAM protein [Rhodococcus jostii]|uniref:radical SAM protein n=1 Tax=Rhodococcus jostii TaxID=132919 RepID=UPI00362C615C
MAHTLDDVVFVGMPRVRRKWSPTAPESIEALQVVYKVAERCNINCAYCYYFNMGEETALARPARASIEVTDALAHWIAQGCEELKIPHVKVCFHGGEPALIGAVGFDEACRRLREIIEPVATLSLSIQTNGTLLNDRWLEAFIEHTVGVGVSIDGPKSAHDRFRLDRHRQSTFGKTEDAIRRLVDAYGSGGPLPSTISVLHTSNDYRTVYQYLRGLGVTEMNFLLPDRNADDAEFVSSGAAAEYGSCLSEIFVEWLGEDNPAVHIKFIDQMLAHFRCDIAPGQVFRRSRKSNQVVIARSDGTVAIDDTFIPALSWYAGTPVHSTTHSTLRDFLGDPIFREIEDTSSALPSGCTACRWRQVCRGGDVENRFSMRNGFDNPSVYCDAYKVMYQQVCNELVRNGYPADLIAAKFGSA